MIQESGLVRLSAQAGSPVPLILPNNNGTKCNDRISPLKVFHVLLYRRSSILQDIYFLYCIGRFLS